MVDTKSSGIAGILHFFQTVVTSRKINLFPSFQKHFEDLRSLPICFTRFCILVAGSWWFTSISEVPEPDIPSHVRQFPELITRWIWMIPTAFWRTRAPVGLFSKVFDLDVGNPVVRPIFDGKVTRNLDYDTQCTSQDRLMRVRRQYKHKNNWVGLPSLWVTMLCNVWE